MERIPLPSMKKTMYIVVILAVIIVIAALVRRQTRFDTARVQRQDADSAASAAASLPASLQVTIERPQPDEEESFSWRHSIPLSYQAQAARGVRIIEVTAEHEGVLVTPIDSITCRTTTPCAQLRRDTVVTFRQTPGTYTLRVKATDWDGKTQTALTTFLLTP